MRTTARLCLTFVALAAIGLSPFMARAQFEHLASKVPSDANAIILLNVDKVMNSPAALKEKWNTDHSKAYASGITFLPPDCETAVMASQYDFEMMKPLWQVAAMNLDHQASLAVVQRLSGGTPDTIGDLGAVALPGDAYVVQFGPQLLAAMSPANRQLVGRWVRNAASAKEARFSPYLTEAYRYANDLGTPIILAMDLSDVATPDAIRTMLQESGKYPDAAAIEQRVALLSSIRGVTLGITLTTEDPFGKVKVDFGVPVTVTPEEAKSILLTALTERGAMLDELDDWIPGVAGSQVTLEGKLTRSGMRRIASLFDRPPAFKKDVDIASSQTPTDQSQTSAQPSQEYFRRVTELLDDLRERPKKQTGGRTLAQNSVWCNQYAKKIDKLPILGVDPELVAYGAYVCEGLRAAAEGITMSSARTTVRQVNTQPQYDYYTYGTTYGYSYRSGPAGSGYVPYGSYGTVGVPDTQAYSRELARAATEERVAGAAGARSVFDQLDQATSEIRRKMTMKYNVEF